MSGSLAALGYKPTSTNSGLDSTTALPEQALTMPQSGFVFERPGQSVASKLAESPQGQNAINIALGFVGMPVETKAPETLESILAFHGTGHPGFEKFDIAKVGTGEGAQTYGHGLYFAEKENIANWYRNRLQLKGPQFVDKSGNFVGPLPEWIVKELGQYKTRPELLARLDRIIALTPSKEGSTLVSRLKAWRNGELDAAIPPPGTTYEVAIKASPENMLHWDLPLNKQPPSVQEALRKISPPVWQSMDEELERRGMNPISENLSAYTGQHLYRLLNSEANELLPSEVPGSSWVTGTTSQQHTSQYLRSLGIPGTRYLDAASRAAENQSYNYVVFDPELIEILKRYGIVGAVGGAGAVTGEQSR